MSAAESKESNEALLPRDTAPVRAGEEFDLKRLPAYLCERFAAEGESAEVRAPGAAAEISVEQFRGGHSNLTYLLRLGAEEFVLRRPPLGRVAPRAHDMAREFHSLTRIHPVFPLAPRPVLLCEDAEVIGATFYLMERRRGTIIRNEEPAEFARNPQLRRQVSASIVETLADLHSIDVAAHKLDALGKPAGFVERQVRGWSERWTLSKTSELPEMDNLAQWLNECLHNIKASTPTALVHGDFKLDNIMLDAHDFSRIVAVFDWEMCAIGDPLVDLGILLAYWVHAASAVSQDDNLAAVTNREGWFTREEIIEHYAARSGRDMSNIRFYEVFAVFKLAVIVQQIFYRYRRGQTNDSRFARLDERVSALARIAAELA